MKTFTLNDAELEAEWDRWFAIAKQQEPAITEDKFFHEVFQTGLASTASDLVGDAPFCEEL